MHGFRMVAGLSAVITLTTGALSAGWVPAAAKPHAPTSAVSASNGLSASLRAAATGHVVGAGDWLANASLVFSPAPESGRFAGFVADSAFLPGVIDLNQLSQLANQALPFSS